MSQERSNQTGSTRGSEPRSQRYPVPWELSLPLLSVPSLSVIVQRNLAKSGKWHLEISRNAGASMLGSKVRRNLLMRPFQFPAGDKSLYSSFLTRTIVGIYLEARNSTRSMGYVIVLKGSVEQGFWGFEMEALWDREMNWFGWFFN